MRVKYIPHRWSLAPQRKGEGGRGHGGVGVGIVAHDPRGGQGS